MGKKLSGWTDFRSSFPGALIEPLDERGSAPSAGQASSRSAANGADSIIIIKFNWHATPRPIVAMALNGLDFLPGCFPLDRFCFAPDRVSSVPLESPAKGGSKVKFREEEMENLISRVMAPDSMVCVCGVWEK